MALNPSGAIDLTLATFGGLNTEAPPLNVVEGQSPDNQEVSFLPGAVLARPGMTRVFATPFSGSFVPTMISGWSFVNQLGDVENFYLDSNGRLWWEDFTHQPRVRSLIGTVTPNSYAKAVTAFGRSYIAISDGLHGTEVPLQWDGTNLDRVTQDGPGAAPTVASVPLPSVGIALSAVDPIVLNINEADPEQIPSEGLYLINFWTNDDISQIAVGMQLTIAGYTGASAGMNGTWPILAIYPANGYPLGSLIRLSAVLPEGTVYSTEAATASTTSGASLIRTNNTVSVTTVSAHGLKPGYLVQISGVPAAVVGTSISSIVIDNKNESGIATVTTVAAHGLKPGVYVSLQKIPASSIGGGIVTLSRVGQVVTVVTTTAHGLVPGSVVSISGASGFNTGAAVVASVVDEVTFTFPQASDDATASGGALSLAWPVPESPTPTYFEVLAAPSTTSFQIAVYYADGTWTGGYVYYAWSGRFFVRDAPSETSFTYDQAGPDAICTELGGTVTPYGQAAPGKHRCRVAYLTRQGAITRPGPWVEFTANGGQYISVSGIPIGPPNVTARILEFTGAQGAQWFYIPVPSVINGQTVSTATQVNDNTTESVLLDFSDNTLYAAVATSIMGNDLASQIILDGALGFGFYGSRLLTWGQRNTIHNLLAMSFDGGALPTSLTLPAGWTVDDDNGSLATGHFGQGFQITVIPGSSPCGIVRQGAYRDCYGAPILSSFTRYRFRCWCSTTVADPTVLVVATISGTGFSSTASVAPTEDGGFVEATFDLDTPDTLPDDIELTVYAVNGTGESVTVLVDECSIIYDATPYLDSIIYGSYVNNPEGFDGVSGKFGTVQDTRKVMDLGTIRQTLYLLTQDPSGRLHSTNDNGTTEPAGWAVDQVASNCGALSAFSLTKSQGDDASVSGAEGWFAWASSSGARIFGGDQPYKISQEIQPDWDAINAAAAHRIWAINDPDQRVIYFGLPRNSATAPDIIYPMTYKHLDTVWQIAQSPAGRKWTRWRPTMNGAALMYREAGRMRAVFFGGNGQAPGLAAGYGHVYILTPCNRLDDDYGIFIPYWTSHFFGTPGQELGAKLGAYRHMIQYTSAYAAGVGFLNITALVNTLTNAWPLTGKRTLEEDPQNDIEWGGGSASGNRIALKFSWSAS